MWVRMFCVCARVIYQYLLNAEPHPLQMRGGLSTLMHSH